MRAITDAAELWIDDHELVTADATRSEITRPAREAFYSGDARSAFDLAVGVGERWIADANFSLIKNKLGVRAAVLKGREDSWRRAGYNDQDRLYLTGKWQIDRKTTLKADFERGKAKRFVPRPFFGLDMTSTWNASGQPIFNNFNASATLSKPAGVPTTQTLQYSGVGALSVTLQDRKSVV